MKKLTLTIANINILNTIQIKLSKPQPLTKDEQKYLSCFLAQIPSSKELLLNNVPLDAQFEVNPWDSDKLEVDLEKWIKLFNGIPGWDYCPFCRLVSNDDIEMLSKNVIVIVPFAPSMAYNTICQEGYKVLLKDDGSAIFRLPALKDAEQYPELHNFKGTWKEAYLLLIETLKKGWPMEEFPEELQQFLKK